MCTHTHVMRIRTEATSIGDVSSLDACDITYSHVRHVVFIHVTWEAGGGWIPRCVCMCGTYVCVYIHTYTHTHTQKCVCVRFECVHVRAYACTCGVCVCVRACAYLQVGSTQRRLSIWPDGTTWVPRQKVTRPREKVRRQLECLRASWRMGRNSATRMPWTKSSKRMKQMRCAMRWCSCSATSHRTTVSETKKIVSALCGLACLRPSPGRDAVYVCVMCVCLCERERGRERERERVCVFE